jgi:Domain of unknown function (DUF4382)
MTSVFFSRLPAAFLRVVSRAFALTCAMALVCLPLTDCGVDYCIQGVINNGTATVGGNNACALTNKMGNVTVQIAASAADFSPGPMAPNLLHLFVNVQGIEANADASAADDSHGWEELAPELAGQPRQIDLLVEPGNSGRSGSIGSAAIPAGAYRQIRLHLTPMEAAMGSAVTPDGIAHALVLANGSSYIHIGPVQIAGGFFHVLPDAETKLSIEFNRFSSFIAPAGAGLGLAPQFTVDSAPADAVEISGR